MFTPASLHRPYHRQKNEKDQKEDKKDRTKRDAFISLATLLLRGTCYLGGLIGGQFQLSYNAVDARINAPDKVTFLETRCNVIADYRR